MQHILGQDAALAVVKRALSSGRLHHAWVFHGPAGVGKFTTALAMARILLCHDVRISEAGDVAACGRCTFCRLLHDPEAAHPDLHVVRKELAQYSDDRQMRERKQMNIPLALVREHLIEPAYRSAALGHHKVFIVDEAELLAYGRNETQNALLKTLEEPPPGTFIILVTSNEDRLLPTIRSRCQRVAFGPLDDAAVARWIADHEAGAELDERRRAWVVRIARGSLGRADLALRYRFDQWHEAVTPGVKRIASGRPDPELGAAMAELVEGFAKQWVDDHKGASKDAANKAGVRHMLGLLGELCRAALRAAASAGETMDTPEADARTRPWLIGIELLQDAERQLNTNVQPALLLDSLAIQWAERAAPRAATR